jgi:hypothetical protein
MKEIETLFEATQRAIEDHLFSGRTPEQSAIMRRSREFGVDLSLLAENLTRTPTERLLHHQSALASILLLQKIGEDHRRAAR